MNTLKKIGKSKKNKSIVLWVLNWLTVQSKKWGSLKGFDNKEYVMGDCSFNVYETKWKIHIEDKEGRTIPAIDEHLFDDQSHAIRTLAKWIKYPSTKKEENKSIETKIFCSYQKFC